MEDVVWLARFTSSGLNQILNMDIELYHNCLQAALKVFEQELNTATQVLIKGYLNPEA